MGDSSIHCRSSKGLNLRGILCGTPLWGWNWHLVCGFERGGLVFWGLRSGTECCLGIESAGWGLLMIGRGQYLQERA